MSNAHFYLQLIIAENSTTKNQFNNYPIYTCTYMRWIGTVSAKSVNCPNPFYIRINWKAIIFIP